MPQFSAAPPSDPRGQPLPLKRCGHRAPLTAIITSEDLLGCPTHFFGGRTVPCETEHCKPCEEGVSWRWHGYIGAYHRTDKLHFIFEMTARCAEVIHAYRLAHGSLRGCLFEASRPSGTRNGRVILRTKPIDLEGIYLPEPPDLKKLLSIIWNLPLPNLSVEGQLKGHPALHVNPKPNGDGHKTPNPTKPNHIENYLQT